MRVDGRNQGLALKCRFEVLLWLQGLEADFLDKTPENQVLRDLAVQKAEAELNAAAEIGAAEVMPQLKAAEAEETKKETAPKKKKAPKKGPAKRGRPKKKTVAK